MKDREDVEMDKITVISSYELPFQSIDDNLDLLLILRVLEPLYE
jgi:hypothetical protein